MTVSARRAATDVAVQVAGRLLNLGLGLAVTLLVVRLLGVDLFGQWSTILAVVQIAGYVADFGLEQVVVRQASTDPDGEARWLGALVVLRVALGVPVFLIAGLILAIIATTDAMLVASAIVVAMSIVITPMGLRAVFQLRTRNGVPVAAMTVQSVLWTAGGGSAVRGRWSGTGRGCGAVRGDDADRPARAARRRPAGDPSTAAHDPARGPPDPAHRDPDRRRRAARHGLCPDRPDPRLHDQRRPGCGPVRSRATGSSTRVSSCPRR